MSEYKIDYCHHDSVTTESRQDYIKREDAIRAIKEIMIYGGDGSIVSDNGVEKYHNRALKMVGTELENIPSADVEEVVHCKDCKWCKHYKQDEQDCYCCTHACGLYDVDRSEDDYCSYGEKKDETD